MYRIWFQLNNLLSPSANHLKFIHKVMDHKKKAKSDFGLDHFFRFGVMPLGLPKNTCLFYLEVGTSMFYGHILSIFFSMLHVVTK
jgi:hypothetical protein